MFNYSKDGITVASVLDNRRKNKSGLYPVKIRVTYNRSPKYYGTGKSMTEADWAALPDTKKRELKEIRESIENSFSIIRDVVQDLAYGAEFSFDELTLILPFE